MFLDLNSYFASVEQQENPELRGKPVGVCPVMADSSFIVAASYEAKAFGVKTGTQIGEAKRLCPEIQLLPAGFSNYVAYHEAVKRALEGVLPIEEVCSIDEMRFRLLGEECQPDRAREIALRMKDVLRDEVGECITASVGIAPNPFLAKIATELEKPNGLVMLEAKDLPGRLLELPLMGFTGINKRMRARLEAHGIFTAADLCAASARDLRLAFGSVMGEEWFYMLRGYEAPRKKTQRRTLGHSHVLAPEFRHEQGCKEVLVRLLNKAAARLRAEGLFASGVSFHVTGFEKSWEGHERFDSTQATQSFLDSFHRLWPRADFIRPRSVGVTFTGLIEKGAVTPSLFDDDDQTAQTELSHAIDSMNRKFGKNSVYLASTHRSKDTAKEKIAFQKTALFSEGLGDNVIFDTFRGIRTMDN